MLKNHKERHEVLISGTGGQGAVTIARLLVESAVDEYPHAFFFPSYGTEQRGGWVQCSVVLADNLEDAQPRLHPDAAIIFSSGGLAEIKQRLGNGGKLFVESSVWSSADKEGHKSDKEAIFKGLYLIPAVQKSHELGSLQVANIIFLGAYLAATGALPLEKVEEALEKKMAGGKRSSLLELNKRALRLGASLVH